MRDNGSIERGNTVSIHGIKRDSRKTRSLTRKRIISTVLLSTNEFLFSWKKNFKFVEELERNSVTRIEVLRMKVKDILARWNLFLVSRARRDSPCLLVQHSGLPHVIFQSPSTGHEILKTMGFSIPQFYRWTLFAQRAAVISARLNFRFTPLSILRDRNRRARGEQIHSGLSRAGISRVRSRILFSHELAVKSYA